VTKKNITLKNFRLAVAAALIGLVNLSPGGLKKLQEEKIISNPKFLKCFNLADHMSGS